MNDPQQGPDSINLVAIRLLVNLLTASAHDTRAEVAMKTGIDLERVSSILAGHSYPDLYEIAAFERAYRRQLWPGPESS